MYQEDPPQKKNSIKTSPFETLTGRKMKMDLPTLPSHALNQTHTVIFIYDHISKQTVCECIDKKRRTWPSTQQLGDYVLAKQKQRNKLTSPYQLQLYIIIQK